MSRKLDIFMAMSEFYEKKFTETAIRLYFRALSDVSDSDFEHACGEHMRRSKWFPKPSELLELLHGTAAKQAEIEAVQAWEAVLNTLKYYGAEALAKMEGKSGMAIRQIGGAERFRIAKETELQWLQKEFEKRYQDACIYPMLCAPEKMDLKSLPQLKGMN
jgi:hypothetical protein